MDNLQNDMRDRRESLCNRRNMDNLQNEIEMENSGLSRYNLVVIIPLKVEAYVARTSLVFLLPHPPSQFTVAGESTS